MSAELINYSPKQLPDNLVDLTQFVLVNKSKLNAYMLKLRTINKVPDAQAIHAQTLEEAQQVSAALIAAERRIGEILDATPTAQGRRTDIIETTSSTRIEEVKTKSEIIAEMGYSKDEASDYQRMAKNPEIVDRVVKDKLAAGELVTKSDVMKQIKAHDKELRQKDTELKKKDSQIEQLKSKISDLEKTLSNIADYDNNPGESAEVEYLRSELATCQQEIEILRSRSVSSESRDANVAYTFWQATKTYIDTVLAPMLYDDLIINNQDNSCASHIIDACTKVIYAAEDVLKRFKAPTIIDIE